MHNGSTILTSLTRVEGGVWRHFRGTYRLVSDPPDMVEELARIVSKMETLAKRSYGREVSS